MAVFAIVIAALSCAAISYWIVTRARDFAIGDLRLIAERAGEHTPIVSVLGKSKGVPLRDSIYAAAFGIIIIGPSFLSVEERRVARLILTRVRRLLWNFRQQLQRTPAPIAARAERAASDAIAEMCAIISNGDSPALRRVYRDALILERNIRLSAGCLLRVSLGISRARALLEEALKLVVDSQMQAELSLPQFSESIAELEEICGSFSNAGNFVRIEADLKKTEGLLAECVDYLRGQSVDGADDGQTVAADPYATLGIAPGASAEEIKNGYRKKAKAYHPDRVTAVSDDPEVQTRLREWFNREMHKLNAAYAELQRQGAEE